MMLLFSPQHKADEIFFFFLFLSSLEIRKRCTDLNSRVAYSCVQNNSSSTPPARSIPCLLGENVISTENRKPTAMTCMLQILCNWIIKSKECVQNQTSGVVRGSFKQVAVTWRQSQQILDVVREMACSRHFSMLLGVERCRKWARLF